MVDDEPNNDSQNSSVNLITKSRLGRRIILIKATRKYQEMKLPIDINISGVSYSNTSLRIWSLESL